MCRKISIISLVLSSILTINFIPPAFSVTKSIGESIDEVQSGVYRKVRCSRCGMEFYYIPDKEGPHAHWVHYEVDEGKRREKYSQVTKAAEGDKGKVEKKEGKGKGMLGLFKETKEVIEEERLPEKELSYQQLEKIQAKEYELRLKLTCPYDGYSFFAEGEVIEDRKLMPEYLTLEELSVIEASFARSIPFGVSKDLRQFGYDLFKLPEERKKEGGESQITAEAGEALTALSMLKAAFSPAASITSQQPVFSSDVSSHQESVVPVGNDYIIGPGDKLIINIWGSVQESFPVEVDREGKIMLPKAGPLYLWGLRFEEAEKRIRGRLNEFYTNFNVDVSMGKLRRVQVFIMGEVRKPGSYSINSQSTIFQALYTAGGPTRLGSLRRIKVIHADGIEDIIDLYPFLLEGERISYTRIQAGDTIFVLPIGDVVAIAGNVKRPAIYETRSEIPLADLLKFSGGITPIGDLEHLQVERIRENERRVVLDIEPIPSDVGKLSLKNIDLQNGDLVIVSPIVRLKHDFVSILGNVERPGDYALKEDMSVSALIKRAKGFMPGTYFYRAEIARVSQDRTRRIIPINLEKMLVGSKEDNLTLKEWDILFVYSEADVQPPSYVDIEGAVARPGKYELTPGMKVSDLIFLAGGLKPNEVIRGAELFHIMPKEQPAVRMIEIKEGSSTNVMVDKDIVLRAGDALFVKSEPKLTERKVVTIQGEVRFPGTYSIRKGEKLSSLIERVGGFTEEAFLEGTVFTRKSIKEAQEKIRERFLERENRTLLEEQQAILLRGSASGIVATTSETLEARQQMLDYIGSMGIEGRMVMKVLPLEELRGSQYDILLEGGDSLVIPQTPSAVTIIGSVNNPTSVPFEPGKGLEYYVHRTGGLTKHADRGGIYVIRANGEAVGRFMMTKTIQRGDTIVVPQELKYWTPPGQLLRDTVDILSRVAVGVGIIAALD